jgi:putative flippase GtrA
MQRASTARKRLFPKKQIGKPIVAPRETEIGRDSSAIGMPGPPDLPPLGQRARTKAIGSVRFHMIPSAVQDIIDRLHAASRERATMFKAVSFGLIGFVNTAVDFGVFSLGYYFFGLPIVMANLLSWAVAVSSSYVLNSTITFSIESRRNLSVRTFATFVVAQLAGFAANTTTVVIASHFMPVLFGKMLATGVSFLVNFSLSHFVVFRKPAVETLRE